MASVTRRTKLKAKTAYENHLLYRFIWGFEKSCNEALARAFNKSCDCLVRVFKELGESIGQQIEQNLQRRVTLQRAGVLHIQPDRQGDAKAQDQHR